MNWDILEGKWEQFKGDVKTQWGKLTNDDLTRIAGHKDRLVGVLQERYGVKQDEAERQASEWITRLQTSGKARA